MTKIVINARIDNMSLDRFCSIHDGLMQAINVHMNLRRENGDADYHALKNKKHKAAKLFNQCENSVVYPVEGKSVKPGFAGIETLHDGANTCIFLRINLTLDDKSLRQLYYFQEELNSSLNKVMHMIIDKPHGEKKKRLLHCLFHHSNDATIPASLLDNIISADYRKIHKIIEQYPQEMFKPVKQSDGSEITPLEYAFNTYDTLTWQHLFRRMHLLDSPFYTFMEQRQKQDNPEPLSLQSIKEFYAQRSHDRMARAFN